MEHRTKRAGELKENGNADLKKYIEKRDSLRRTYYKAYTGHEIGDYKDYHICVDTGVLGMGKTAQMLAQMIREYDK